MAREPGISIDDIAKRVAEGPLASDRTDSNVRCGRMVARSRRDMRERSRGDRALVETLRDRRRYCKEHLDTRREVLREHRRLLAGLIERVHALEASVEPSASSRSREERAQGHVDRGPFLQRAVRPLRTTLSLPPGGEGCWVVEFPTCLALARSLVVCSS